MSDNNPQAWKRANTDWFKDAKWGVFGHFLAGMAGGFGEDVGQSVTSDEWNKRVDSVDVAKLADQLEEIGAGYCMFTIGQNSGHFCSPNDTYDSIVGIKPSKLSRRDLIADIAEALKSKGIRMMVYSPSGCPVHDLVACEKLEWKWNMTDATYRDTAGAFKNTTGDRLVSFQLKWEQVIREWSMRWGDSVKGWWMDGCYFPDDMYRFDNAPNFRSFSEALKSGNPNSLVAFNPGVITPVICYTEYEDYTAGELSLDLPASPGRWVEGAQYHTLGYLGSTWGAGEPRYVDELVYGYTKDVISKQGVVSWDVVFNYNGTIRDDFFQQLKCLRDLRQM